MARDIVPPDGKIPAHLLGNMWAQQWGTLSATQTESGGDRGYDLTQILKARNTEPKQLVRYGESFFTSLDRSAAAYFLGTIALTAHGLRRGLSCERRDID